MSSCISRLPDSTTRLISSHLIVVTPVLLVKELLDNAIDAQATSVEILLSPDTISRIEVRDDGVGIHPDDYDALGRRGHTSKLRNISELRDIVGKTLGFRGEALAGVNSMANVTVTTKVSTEPVAAVLQLKPNEGGVLTLKPASAPVGTTVSVTGLFGRQPVRKQMAAKEAKKTLDKIQALLRAYAMARPRLRLLFKVLQTPAKTWSYSPKRNATAMEAVLQLFGADVTSKCLAKRFRRGPSSTDGGHATQGPAQRASDDFMFEAILANPDVDLQKAPKQHFFSVDGRPINAGRGIAKRLLSVYLEHLRHSTLMRNTSDCFIRVDICCRPGSYDANIEPSKDDVLFSNEQVVIDAFKCLCSETYSSVAICQQVAPGEVNTRISGVPIAISQTEDHTLLHQSESQPNSQGCTPQITNSSEISPDVSSQCSKTSVDQEAAVREPASYQRSRETQSSITFKPINARRTPRGLRSGVLAEQVNETTSALEQGKVNVPVGLNEHSERIYRERHQIAVNPSRSQETTVTHEAHILDDRLNPWMIAKSSHLNEAPPPKSPRPPMYSPLSPLTPEPPVLRHIMAPPGDLDLPSGHADMRRARLLRPQQPPVPGGPYRSPMSNPLERKQQANPITPADYSRTNPHRPRPRRRQPPWTPPSVEKPHYSDASLIGPTHLQQTDGFKQTQISFGGTQASHCRRSAQRDIPPTQPGSIGPLNTLGADGHVNIQDMFSTAKKNLQYQLSQIEGDQRPNTWDSSGRSRAYHDNLAHG
ncbi:hypothetical protein F4802DRAFT_215402 [Xylaria palmicola]|nr:hypothetical protein F4802DRAFT_215402 [Xylaria palmicola]